MRNQTSDLLIMQSNSLLLSTETIWWARSLQSSYIISALYTAAALSWKVWGFDSSWRLRIFSVFNSDGKTKNISLFFIKFTIFIILFNLTLFCTHLVSSTNKIQIMFGKEFRYNIWTKGKGNPSVIFTPSLDILVWIWPQQVT